jgi:2'-5' RNA ligase
MVGGAYIRAFIGFLLPEAARKDVTNAQKTVGSLPASCKMVERENLHVSLSFLGEVEEDKIGPTADSLKVICDKHQTFEVVADKIKLIPNENYVRVVVLNTASKTGDLEEISSEIREKVGGSVKPPHITLCRVRRVVDKKNFLCGVKKIDNIDIRFVVDSISIIKSELSPKGPMYSVVKKIKLGGR